MVNNTLFVLFGKGLDGTLQSSMLLVDVADIANISYTAAFGAAKGTQSDNPSSTGLSKGAVGGIVAGVIFLVTIYCKIYGTQMTSMLSFNYCFRYLRSLLLFYSISTKKERPNRS